MKIKLVNVQIHKEAGIIVVDKFVPMYEASILRMMYGEELVDVLTGVTGMTVETENARDEYTRLQKLYGADRERNASRVELIFGFYETGQFEKAYNDSVVEDIEDAVILEQDLPQSFMKTDGSAYKREADLVNALKKSGLEGNYSVIEIEEGFIGNLS